MPPSPDVIAEWARWISADPLLIAVTWLLLRRLERHHAELRSDLAKLEHGLNNLRQAVWALEARVPRPTP